MTKVSSSMSPAPVVGDRFADIEIGDFVLSGDRQHVGMKISSNGIRWFQRTPTEYTMKAAFGIEFLPDTTKVYARPTSVHVVVEL